MSKHVMIHTKQMLGGKRLKEVKFYDDSRPLVIRVLLQLVIVVGRIHCDHKASK